MLKVMTFVIHFDMFINPGFKMTACVANVARTTGSTSKLIY